MPGIYAHIGRRPIAAFGNSDGDQQMLEWTQAGAGTRLMMLVRHDDAAREWAYHAQSKIRYLQRRPPGAGEAERLERSA